MKLNNCQVILPTFYPGKKIVNCINSIPDKYPIAIIDNGNDDELLDILKKLPRKISHYKVGDIGLPKSFNFALSISNSNYIFITQPDVILEKNCIENLLIANFKYANAGILCPIFYEKRDYSLYDHYDLKFNKKNFKLLKTKKNNNSKIVPSGDFCVEAVNSTALLVKKDLLIKIGMWDENIYTYLEDIDMSLRMRIAGHEIIKVCNSRVFHGGFQSHKIKNREIMNISRNWHYCWSSIYFIKKHSTSYNFFLYFIEIFIKYFFKSLAYFLFNNSNKFKQNFTRLKACLSFLFFKTSYYRSVIKND